MKTMKLWRIAFMILAAFSLASCSMDSNEPEKPFTVCPEKQIKLFAEAQKMAQLRYKTYIRKSQENWSEE